MHVQQHYLAWMLGGCQSHRKCYCNLDLASGGIVDCSDGRVRPCSEPIQQQYGRVSAERGTCRQKLCPRDFGKTDGVAPTVEEFVAPGAVEIPVESGEAGFADVQDRVIWIDIDDCY